MTLTLVKLIMVVKMTKANVVTINNSADLEKNASSVRHCLASLRELALLSLNADMPISADLLLHVLGDNDSKANALHGSIAVFGDSL